MKRTRKPSMPGEVLKEMYLEPLDVTITDFAERIGVSRKTVSALVNGRAPVTVDMALRLSMALNTTPDLWLNLQRAVDLWNARQKKGSWMQIQPLVVQPA